MNKLRSKIFFFTKVSAGILLIVMIIAFAAAYLDIKRLGKGPIWHIPSRIYSAETKIEPGTNIETIGLTERLKRLRYRPVKHVRAPGEYQQFAGNLTVYLHAFDYPDGQVKPQKVTLYIDDNIVETLVDTENRNTLNGVTLEPECFAEIFDQRYEDRSLIKLSQCPDNLIHAIVATEDKRFFHNWGIDLRSIFRAGVKNLTHGRIVEGGSTITQQLIKNLFLTSERSYSRKIKETWMSLVMEIMFSKEEILEMYMNEIYLGQWGNAGIYGFGRAANIYFNKDIQDINLSEAALLAGIIRAPNLYSPYKHPEKALNRRNTVLTLLQEQDYIDNEAYRKALKAPLGVAPFVPRSRCAPYFVDHLLATFDKTYPVGDLSRGGYKIFTTLDMHAQITAETKLSQALKTLPAPPGTNLDAAFVMLDAKTGEIRAMVGGRDYATSQFNRAAQMHRQIGSLIKPYIYYTALTNGFVLSSFLDDGPLTYLSDNGKEWTPNNFDQQTHGQVLLADALIYSYNIATVRLGLGIGLPIISQTLHSVLPDLEFRENPSLLLGALECSPLQVASLYTPFANMGNHLKPWALKTVMKDATILMDSYPPRHEQVLASNAVYLIDTCLADVMRFGTAKKAVQYGMPEGFYGKTGTTNEMRDSWFVCFNPDFVAVTWVGNDEFKSVDLTGSTGALPVASKILGGMVSIKPIDPPIDIITVEVDPTNGKLASRIADKRAFPYIQGTEPVEHSDRDPRSIQVEDIKKGIDKVFKWFKSIF